MRLSRACLICVFMGLLWLGGPSHTGASQVFQSDLCVFGATSAGVAAAVEAAREGRKVVLTEFGGHVGGMTAGGLSQTDIGNKAAIGGLAREFYQRVGRHYGVAKPGNLNPAWPRAFQRC
jgi:ribulose 1,5-bisphosphate synthetase/thiazole synthase